MVPVYRKFVHQHYRLSAYLHTNGANAVDSTYLHALDMFFLKFFLSPYEVYSC